MSAQRKRSYFDEEDDDDECGETGYGSLTASATLGGDEDEVDPLDAFMYVLIYLIDIVSMMLISYSPKGKC